jgi:putative tryptophan/tyrosine transport system substrate-binding protein
MKRRDFIAMLGGAAAWPLAARAEQSAAIPVIGWISGRSSKTDAAVLPAFRQSLNAQGFFEGQNVTIEYRWADGHYDRIPALVADLVHRRVNVIVAPGMDEQGMRTIKAASSIIPILFLTAGDPVEMGLVPNFNHPGGNITGVTSMLSGLAQKRLGLLHELVPKALNLAVLFNPANAASSRELANVLEATRGLNVQIKRLEARNEREIDTAFATLAKEQPNALLVLTDPFFFDRANQIVASAARVAIPTLYFRREFTVAGGLMSYGSNAEEYYRAVGDYAGRILKGAKPADLPVLQSTKFEMVINIKTAKALGLEVPPMLLARADEVIE